ncbi:MAG: flagellar biosynthetic protein FliO [Pseudomonadota bacterium]|nr:flagellar biosynthetic protein FliO [Pseudomonadota bacterium]
MLRCIPMYPTLAVAGLMPGLVLAADAAAAPEIGAGWVLNLVFGLVLVLGLFLALAWLMRKLGTLPGGNGRLIRVVGGASLGARDRLVLVELGQQQLLLGVSPGRIVNLHTLPERLDTASGSASTRDFSATLRGLLGPDR